MGRRLEERRRSDAAQADASARRVGLQAPVSSREEHSQHSKDKTAVKLTDWLSKWKADCWLFAPASQPAAPPSGTVVVKSISRNMTGPVSRSGGSPACD